MILLVTPENRHQYSTQIKSYFRIRKSIFADRLGWDVVCHGDEEFDMYDHMDCYYILALDDAGEVLGGLRQMRMSGPTLTWEKFGDMLGNPADFLNNNTFETTRFAIRSEKKDFRFGSGVNRVAVELCIASLQFGLDYDVTQHIAVCEKKVIDLTRSFRMPCHVYGRKQTNRGEDILCIGWEVNDEAVERLSWAQNYLGVA